MKHRLETRHKKPASMKASVEALPEVKVCLPATGCVRFTNQRNSHDQFLAVLFHGTLCLFLLEMGMTAAKRLKDLKQYVAALFAFGLIIRSVIAIPIYLAIAEQVLRTYPVV